MRQAAPGFCCSGAMVAGMRRRPCAGSRSGPARRPEGLKVPKQDDLRSRFRLYVGSLVRSRPRRLGATEALASPCQGGRDCAGRRQSRPSEHMILITESTLRRGSEHLLPPHEVTGGCDSEETPGTATGSMPGTAPETPRCGQTARKPERRHGRSVRGARQCRGRPPRPVRGPVAEAQDGWVVSSHRDANHERRTRPTAPRPGAAGAAGPLVRWRRMARAIRIHVGPATMLLPVRPSGVPGWLGHGSSGHRSGTPSRALNTRRDLAPRLSHMSRARLGIRRRCRMPSPTTRRSAMAIRETESNIPDPESNEGNA